MAQSEIVMGELGGCTNVAYGVCDDITTAGTEIRIDTGLSSINKFEFSALAPNYGPAHLLLQYDKSISTTEYATANCFGSGAYGGRATMGNYVNTYAYKLESISGGVVVLNAPSVARADVNVQTKLSWMAMQ